MRRWSAGLLVVLTSMAVVVATLAVWAHNTVFDTDTFMDTVEPGLDDQLPMGDSSGSGRVRLAG